jgi:hypothetical protein
MNPHTQANHFIEDIKHITGVPVKGFVPNADGASRVTAPVSKISCITKALLLERLEKHGANYAAPMFPFCCSTPEVYNEVMADKNIPDSVKSSFLWDYPLECLWDTHYFLNKPVSLAERPENLPSKAWIQRGITADDQKTINQYFLKFPAEIKVLVWDQYCRVHNSLGGKRANLFLKTLNADKWSKCNVSYSKDRLASLTKEAIDSASSTKEALRAGRKIFIAEDVSPPVGKHSMGVLARMVDPEVWERKLKKRGKQRNEKAVRDKGRIFREGEVYSSDYTVNRYIEMQKDSQAFLKRQQVISDAGDELSLATIAASTVANPAHRRAEMMTRMRGTEDIAKEMGMVCLFVTFTAASIYHPKRFVKQGAGKKQGYFINNPNFQPFLERKDKKGKRVKTPNTPKAAHAFIKRIMNRSIAQFKREKLDYLGYKVVEPHHDGTPHWHSAIFIRPEDKGAISKILTHYALQEYSDERGAKKHRIKIKDHDPKQGSVTGYMAKYISKGISGLDVGEDDETGLDAEDSIIRLLAWKSLWNIRQFAFFGSPSVTVWRELRRIREPLANPSLEKVRLAADAGDWGIFAKLMKKNRITLKMVAVEDAKGRIKTNQYKEVVERVFGLEIEGLTGLEVIRTRFKEWFLVDLEKLEQRIIRGLPFQYREDAYYLEQVKGMIEKAVKRKKVCRLHQGTGGVVPFTAMAASTISATAPPWTREK